jgi:hypothetical protein
MRKKAPVLRSIPSPTRKVGQASPSPLRLAPASQPGPAGPPGQRCGDRSGRSRLRQAPGQGSGRVDLSAPLIPLTLRAMNLAQLLRPRSAALPVASLLSVLAVLALACSPALAHAEEATGPQYEPEIPTVPMEESSPGGGGHHNGGGTGGGNAGISNSPDGNGTGGGSPDAGGSSHTGQGNQGPTGNGGQPEAGSVSSGVAIGEGGGQSQPGGTSSAVGEDDSSSPLVPILIAIVVLAAISIGAYYYRQRRQDPGSSVSPKAS